MVFTVEAYSFASTFSLREVAFWVPNGAIARLRKTLLHIEWSAESFAFAFDFGAIVFINVPKAIVRDMLSTFARQLTREPHAPLEDEFLVEVREGAPSVDVTFERVVIPHFSPVLFEVIATVLAQSVALDYYDEDAQRLMKRVGAIANDIAERGEPRGRGSELIRFAGEAIASQVEIISAISLLDKPDATWEDELADRLHTKLRNAFEIPERYRALEAKLMTIREATAAFLDLTSQRRTFLVEVAIVVLILVEVVLGLFQTR